MISETKDCFDHLVRIIAQKAALFSENNRHRRIPKDFPASSTGTLSDLITWLMPWTAKYEKETRHKAMEALFNLSRDLKVRCHSRFLSELGMKPHMHLNSENHHFLTISLHCQSYQNY